MQTRAVQLNLDAALNLAGAENVSTWSTGFPSTIDLTQAAPRSYGIEYSATSILDRRECDTAILFGCQVFNLLDSRPDIKEHLSRIPVVHFDWHKNHPPKPLLDTSELIQLTNLCPFPDDFVRFDDAIFTVAPNEELTSEATGLSEFLLELNNQANLK